MQVDPHVDHLHAKYVYISKPWIDAIIGKRVIISSNPLSPILYNSIGIFCVIVDKKNGTIGLFSHYSSGKLEKRNVRTVPNLASIKIKELKSDYHLSKPY